MDRTATQPQQFLTWIGDTPYMVSWTPKGEFGSLSGTLAGDFFGAADWSQTIPVEAADDIGLDLWAMQTAAFFHAAAAGRNFPQRQAA
ncbi:hypothetical protein A6A04_18215 [Paramagnetospirillum marisnigri]|uniref:Uncharacterized protein n=1 Tax=Paramagnetospirillum marisnigri TaxID=1285242 RepID=A0A178MR51_9PROT|nr:hypothetical protein [Paramagnetospirillum marisnigri]OAN50527.1 hypothetical protein A6A04_18215 [Paramagnetospirillum marisnigri]